MKISWIVSLLVVSACASSPNRNAASGEATPPTTAPATAKAEATASATVPVTKAQDAGASNAVTCRSGKEERTLALKTADGGGCELTYTKAGATKTIATQRSGTARCAEVMNKTRANLEASGFKCE